MGHDVHGLHVSSVLSTPPYPSIESGVCGLGPAISLLIDELEHSNTGYWLFATHAVTVVCWWVAVPALLEMLIAICPCLCASVSPFSKSMLCLGSLGGFCMFCACCTGPVAEVIGRLLWLWVGSPACSCGGLVLIMCPLICT